MNSRILRTLIVAAVIFSPLIAQALPISFSGNGTISKYQSGPFSPSSPHTDIEISADLTMEDQATIDMLDSNFARVTFEITEFNFYSDDFQFSGAKGSIAFYCYYRPAVDDWMFWENFYHLEGNGDAVNGWGENAFAFDDTQRGDGFADLSDLTLAAADISIMDPSLNSLWGNGGDPYMYRTTDIKLSRVPEPTAMTLLAFGFVMIFLIRHLRSRALN